MKRMNAEQLQEVGKALARLHLIPPPPYLSTSYSCGLQVYSTFTNRGIDSEYEYWLQGRLHFLEKNFPSNLPRGLIHGDLFFDNVLFEQGQFKAIIDFESACNYFFVFDLGMSILGLCIDRGTLDWRQVKAFIKGYEGLRRLETIEKESLLFFIEYAAIATSFWRFRKYNIQSLSTQSKNKHWEMVEIAKEINTLVKEDFTFNDVGYEDEYVP